VNIKNPFLFRFQVSVLLNNAALSKALENKCKQQSTFVGVALRKGLEKNKPGEGGGGLPKQARRGGMPNFSGGWYPRRFEAPTLLQPKNFVLFDILFQT